MARNSNHTLNLIKTICLYSIILCVMMSCRKDIDIKLPEYKEKLVVEGSIETGEPATVLLSVTAPFFGGQDFSDPTKFFVKNAFVTVSDGFQIDTLKEVFQGLGYAYTGSKVLGYVGGNYELNIAYDGKTYKANTTIFSPVALDSIYFKAEKDTLGFMWGHLTEPSGEGNNYRWFAKRLHRDLFYAAPFSSAFDDKFIDGKSFEFSYERPPQPNQQQQYENEPDAGYYKTGDTVVVKFCTIGVNEYLFWRSYYTNKMSNGNPFSAPSNLKNTIQGGEAIGVFCGYSPSFDTLIIKKTP